MDILNQYGQVDCDTNPRGTRKCPLLISITNQAKKRSKFLGDFNIY